MKKLSDYRIREKNGKFIIEGCVEITERRFLKKVINFEWHQLNVYGEVAGFTRRLDGMRVKEFNTLEEAKAKIVELCEEPKYYYVVPDYSLKELPNFALGQKRYKVQSVPSMDIPYPLDLLRADIEYLVKCRAEIMRKINKNIV